MSEKLTNILFNNLGLVIEKFLETHSKVYDGRELSQAVSNALLILSQNNFSYVCEVGSTAIDDDQKDLIYHGLLDYLDWQNQTNLEILKEYFPGPLLRVVDEDDKEDKNTRD